MNLLLQRNPDGRRADGIFSSLVIDDISERKIAVTVEHAYNDGPTNGAPNWQAKLYNGSFTCIRGTHTLESGETFETFEITGVDGHTGILFHWGNVQENSKGCVCTGEEFIAAPVSPLHEDMVTNSRTTFASFMAVQAGVDSFILTVEG